VEIASRRDRQSLHHRQAEHAPDGFDPRRGFGAVQLQHVRLQSLDRRVEQRIVGVDGQRDLLRALEHARGKRVRVLECQVPRRWRKEHEAHHVGARLERDIEGLRCREAADFDDDRHACLKSPVLDWRTSTSLRRVCLAGTTASYWTGARSRSRSRGLPVSGTLALPLGTWRSDASSLRNSRMSRSKRRAVRRKWPCRRHDAAPPITTPAISSPMTRTNSGKLSEVAGCSELNGSSDTVTI